MRVLVLTLLLTATAAFSQPPAGQGKPLTGATQPDVRPARIEGRVLEKDTATPVPQAEVKLAGKVTTSANDGRFVLEDIAPGAALGTISATKAGFLDGGASPEATGISLGPGATLKEALVYLLPQAVISGRITDSNRDPARGVQALLLRQGFGQAWPYQRRWTIATSVQADSAGTFRIANLRPGRYVLLAFRRQKREAPTGPAPEEEDVATFYPNSASLAAAAAIDLTAGQQVQGLQIQMRKERVFSLSGKLAKANVAPGALINVVPEDTQLPMGFFGQPVPMRPDGSFEYRGLLPGRYTVIALDPVQKQPTVTGLASINITDQSITNYEMPATGGVTLHGIIELEGEDLQRWLPPYEASAQASLTIPEEKQARWTVLFEQDDKLLPFFDAYIQQDGTFAFDNALPFPAQLAYSPPKGLYVKSARMGGQDLFRNDLHPALGGDIRITLAKGSGSATVQVPSPCVVVLWSEEPVRGLSGIGVKSVNVTAGASANFVEVRPGKYYVAAFRGVDVGLARNQQFLNLIALDAAKLEIPEGGQASGVAPLIAAEKIKAAEQKIP